MNNSPSIEQRLVELKEEGLTPIEAIKEIRLVYGLPLAEAKRFFSLSPAWSKEVSVGNCLHEEIMAALEMEGK